MNSTPISSLVRNDPQQSAAASASREPRVESLDECFVGDGAVLSVSPLPNNAGVLALVGSAMGMHGSGHGPPASALQTRAFVDARRVDRFARRRGAAPSTPALPPSASRAHARSHPAQARCAAAAVGGHGVGHGLGAPFTVWLAESAGGAAPGRSLCELAAADDVSVAAASAASPPARAGETYLLGDGAVWAVDLARGPEAIFKASVPPPPPSEPSAVPARIASSRSGPFRAFLVAMQVRSISHWSPHDRVRVVNADP